MQTALISLLTAPLANAWSLVHIADPSSMTAFIQAITALVHHFGMASASQAALGYETKRKAAGVAGTFTARPAPPADPAKIEASIRWATKDLWKPNPDMEAIHSMVLGVVEKDVLDAGRQTVLNAVKSDRSAATRGRIPRSARWERECEPGACSFCALLATRGAVYHSEQKADFQAHDHCRCFAAPGWGDYVMPQQIQDYRALYQSSTKGVHGMKNMQKAFRVAYDQAYPKAAQ